jgi:lysophospholipase L1-like esterase
MEKLTQPPKLFALLVGIGDYSDRIVLNETVRFPKLGGPPNDVTKLRSYLENDMHYKPEIKVLSDSEATKENIIAGFLDHLSTASSSDVVLFYFSGHGTQEYTGDRFKSETDGKLECIVAWYDEATKHNSLISDKELRWLIAATSKNNPHIVTIFDCCHSTDVTRNFAIVKNAFGKDRPIEKRVAYVFPARPWNDFVFSEQISEEEIMRAGDEKLLPESPHIALTASESNEAAIEMGGEGVFTKVMLYVLQKSNGNISYQSLMSRTRLLMKDVFEQKPWVYAPGDDKRLLLARFLNKPLDSSREIAGEMAFKGRGKWLFNLGALHGVAGGSMLDVLDPVTFKTTGKALVKEVFISTALVEPTTSLENSVVYPIATSSVLVKPMKLFLANSAALPTDHQKVADGLALTLSHAVTLADSEENADYCLRFINGLYFITRRYDPYRPVVEPVSVDDVNFVSLILTFLEHIAKWEFFKTLENPDNTSQIGDDAIDVEVRIETADGTFRKTNGVEKIIVELFQRGASFASAITISLTNKSEENLYVCAQYLTTNYMAFTKWINPPVYVLEKGNRVDLQIGGRKEMTISLEPYAELLNLERQLDQINIIYSQEKFDNMLLEFDGLPMLSADKPRSKAVARGINVQPVNEEEAQVKKWSVQRLELEVMNPLHNKITASKIKKWLKTEATADFVTGIYFDFDDGIDQTLALKPEIEIPAAERGSVGDKIIDVANWWAQRGRNRYYSKIMKRYPDRVRIVAEGDSWFQHPLVHDVIDHLSKLYSIYCVSAAGDTLMNFLSQQKKNGEYFVDAIRDHKPVIFLISGGGNDILGSQFRDFLADNPDLSEPVGENPARFLKSTIFTRINDLMDMYTTIMKHLQVNFPNLYVIVHGYDYPIRLNDAKKGWLGRYMIEKGIDRAGDRIAIIHLIMDAFNTKLNDVTLKFKNASYIDVRNIVREDQWYDEIHPDATGFQLVALKFMAKIDEIAAGLKP